MSILNWEFMEEIGIAGRWSPTCLVAALDCQIKHDIPYYVYAKYKQAYIYQCHYGPNKQNTKNAYHMVLKAVTGSTSNKNFIGKMAKSPEQTAKILNNAKQGGKKIIIWVGPTHVVGLCYTRNGWKMVGNDLPCIEELSAEGVFRYLHKARRHNKYRENIYLVN